MFEIDNEKTIHLTSGDVAALEISAVDKTGGAYTFAVGDVVRLKVVEKNRYDSVVLEKDVNIKVESLTAKINLSSEDTRIGELINKPKIYWYEIELNPDTAPQTIIGHDKKGPKQFCLYPEGDDSN